METIIGRVSSRTMQTVLWGFTRRHEQRFDHKACSPGRCPILRHPRVASRAMELEAVKVGDFFVESGGDGH